MNSEDFTLDTDTSSLDWLLPEHARIKSNTRKYVDRLYVVSSTPDNIQFGQARMISCNPAIKKTKEGLELAVTSNMIVHQGPFPEWGENQKELVEGCCDQEQRIQLDEDSTRPVYGEAVYIGEQPTDGKHLGQLATTGFAYFLIRNYREIANRVQKAAANGVGIPLFGSTKALSADVEPLPWLKSFHTTTRREDNTLLSEDLIVYGAKGADLEGLAIHADSSVMEKNKRIPKESLPPGHKVLTNKLVCKIKPLHGQGNLSAQLIDLQNLAREREADAVHLGFLPADPSATLEMIFATAAAHFAARYYEKAFRSYKKKPETVQPPKDMTGRIITLP